MTQPNLRIGPLSKALCLAVGAVLLLSAKANAQATVNLIAAPMTKTITLPNGTAIGVPSWGFAVDANGNHVLDAGEVPSVPGPRLSLPAGTSTLTVQLTNLLPEPVSFAVLGQQASGAPVRDGSGRIVAMAPEAAANGGTATYTFSGLKPGTFLYESGSHQAVQVQMGLYGALTLNAADAATGSPAQAYAGTSFDADTLLLFSEIDPALHDAVVSGNYGPGKAVTSTIDYAPSIFLINGESYHTGAASLQAGQAGQRTLLRLLNAGLESHVFALAPPSRDSQQAGQPAVDGMTLQVVSEDGNKYGDPRAQVTVLLPAGKTHDALWVPMGGGEFSAYDRALRLEAGNQALGGMLAKLAVTDATSANSGPVQAVPDSVTLAGDTAGSGNVLANDTGAATAEIYSMPMAGSVVFAPNGSFTYTPQKYYSGVDSFWYRAVAANGIDKSTPTLVTLVVTPVPHPPTALPLSLGLTAKASKAITMTGTDPDGDPLSFRLTSLPAHGTLSYVDPSTASKVVLKASDLHTASVAGTPIPNGTVLYTPDPVAPYVGPDSYAFVVADGVGGGLGGVSASPATVSITVHAAATDTVAGTPIALQVLGVDPRNPGAAPQSVSDFKWTLEEDRTYQVTPGTLDPNTLAVAFHKSYMPVVQSGDASVAPRVEAGKRYFLSVLPKSGGYSNGGAPIAAGQASVSVYVDKMPIPTAQVRVRVFHDNAPLNNQFDSDESPLQGFQVTLDDAGGRYGISGGLMSQDAFGNPLGTTYKACDTAANPGGCDGYQVEKLGNGFLLSDDQGFVTFQNLRPGKYTAKVIPPAGQGWQQTTTIEGQKGQDAWVKANEPTFFQEFGAAGPHVEIGFVRPTNALTPGAGKRTVTGRITNLHQSRPPDFTMFSGSAFDFTRAWVGLNEGVEGSLVWAQPTNPDGTFSIPNVPPGTYTLAIWDSALDVIFASKSVTVNTADVPMGDIPVFSWFTRQYHYVYEDLNKNGMRDAGERGIREVTINTRWRDATVNLSSATDGSGFVPFEETFPYFAWQIAEVDYGRFRATGVTTVVDDGGDPTKDNSWSQDMQAVNDGGATDPRVLVPQPQQVRTGWGGNEAPTYGGRARTETGIALLEGFQGFVGQTNVFIWGKAPYDAPGSHPVDVNVAPFDDFPGPGDIDWNQNGKFDVDEFNGGITGIVHYSTTRAENNARWGTPEPWEPGIAGITVQLWDATRTHLLNEVKTDSWDERVPTGCQGTVFTYLGQSTDCYDGMRNWNQVRPAVFDGGYAFYTVKADAFNPASPNVAPSFELPFDQRTAELPLPAGKYVVKVVVPNGYQLVKEEDKNVDFGDEYIPAQFYLQGYPLADAGGLTDAQPREKVAEEALIAPFCVGDLHEVPAQLALFPGVLGAYGGAQMPLCDEKLLNVLPGSNSAANFFLFTEAPIAGHIIGFVLDDLSNEFDQNSPQFGEKYAPPFLPVSIRDWTGREISRTYTDRYGVYNALVPSTYTASTPIPSGMTPSMLTACINAPLKADGTPDAFYNKQYSQFCYTLQYMPGTTTYLDTPVVPTGAFAGPGQATLDAELPDKTPVIFSATQGTSADGGVGPYIVDGTAAQRTITIVSSGPTQVSNPAYDANSPDGGGVPRLITRDYGFGAAGELWVGTTRIPAGNVTWTDAAITAIIPTGTATGQLKVVRCQNAGCTSKTSTVMGVTLTVATPTYHAAHPPHTVSAGSSIQAAIDASAPGDLVLVGKGTYDELVIMDKPVRLQGWGAPSTIINAVKTPAEKLQAWRDRLTSLLSTNAAYLLGFQQTELAALLPPDQTGELLGPVLGGEGAAVTVLGQNLPFLGASCPQVARPVTILGVNTDPNGVNAFGLQTESGQTRAKARIDGFGVTGSDQAAGIEVNAFACNLEVLNNRIFSNTGEFASGVKLGHPGAVPDLADDPAHNEYVKVANNHILQNTSLDYDAGGAIAIGTGTSNYAVTGNFIAGNFTQGRGAGIAHIGLSDFGQISGNTIVFNEVFNQDNPNSGGGIYLGGRSPAANELTPGAGDVVVSNNLIQANAAIGDGGGVSLAYVNGEALSLVQRALHGGRATYRVQLFGNTIVNNVAGLAGGGVALQDAVNVEIFHQTVAHNDSLAVAGVAFRNGPNQSTPQPAGIVSRGNSSQLVAAGGGAFSNPVIWNSIIWENRSFYYGPCPATPDPQHPCTQNLGNGTGPAYGLLPRTTSPYWDFAVLGPSGSLNVSYSVATSFAGATGSNNSTTAPALVRMYFNGDRKQTIQAPDIASAIPVPAVFDEGGNFIRPMFGPLTLTRLDNQQAYGDYHVSTGANGQPLYTGQISNVAGRYTNAGQVPQALVSDTDGNSRTQVGVYPTRGADQLGGAAVTATLSVADAGSVQEPVLPLLGTSFLTFTITLTGAHATPVDVSWSTANGTAVGGTSRTNATDYLITTGSATFAASNAASQTLTVQVPVINNSSGDVAQETLYLNISSSTATLTRAQAVGTIVNR